MVCAPVRRDNPRALARGLSTVQAHKPCGLWYNVLYGGLMCIKICLQMKLGKRISVRACVRACVCVCVCVERDSKYYQMYAFSVGV